MKYRISIFLVFLASALSIQCDVIVINLPDMPPSVKPLEMIRIDSGDFLMGASEDEVYYPGLEWPSHSVRISNDFYIGKYEVTQAQWAAVMGENPAKDYGVGDDYPVYYASWDDCLAFTERLTQMFSENFRLPTEAEWEYACRAGTETRFSFGDGPEFDDFYHYYEEPARFMWWFGNNDPNGVKPVGLKAPNPWGLFDMHGNLYEWCSDWWQNPYPREMQIDPQGPESGELHVVKGGHWYGSILHCRSAFRFYEREAEERGGVFFGFRVVMDLPETSLNDWELYER